MFKWYCVEIKLFLFIHSVIKREVNIVLNTFIFDLADSHLYDPADGSDYEDSVGMFGTNVIVIGNRIDLQVSTCS